MILTTSTHKILSSFLFTHTPTTEIYTLSLHDALPIFLLEDAKTVKVTSSVKPEVTFKFEPVSATLELERDLRLDRKSTRLNSSHLGISYAVFCLKKKKIQEYTESSI